MKFNNVELEEIDILEAETAENVEVAIDDVIADIEESKKAESLSEMIKIQCTSIFNCFNTIFGEGTDKKVFGDRTNLRICVKAFRELQTYIDKQVESITKEFVPTEAKRTRRK